MMCELSENLKKVQNTNHITELVAV